MGSVQENRAKAFPNLADANRQDLAVSMFCQARSDQELGRMTAIKPKGAVASAQRYALSATAFGKNQHYSQRYEPGRRRYPANGGVDDEQRYAEEEGDEGAPEGDYDYQDEDVF